MFCIGINTGSMYVCAKQNNYRYRNRFETRTINRSECDVKGNSTVGTITDIDGNYTLSVPSDKAVLVYSYIGYTSQEVTVGQQSTINILLKEDAQALDEVVVVGYGVVKKRDLVGSIASVKSQDITAVPTSNVLESMQGKIAGLDMTRSSGQPGSSFNFTIRGNRSLTASNAPLILVDGIAYGADIDINPNDVESIEVLKMLLPLLFMVHVVPMVLFW